MANVRIWALAGLALCAAGAHAQNRKIDAASIRPSTFPTDAYFAGWLASVGGDVCSLGGRRPAPSGNRLTLPKMSLCQLIAMGNSIAGFRVIGGPAWMRKAEASSYYDVQIKAEGDQPLTVEESRALLRDLLADRFQLKLHRDTAPLPVYVLAAGKNGPKIREVAEGQTQRTGVPMASYVGFLSRYVDRPILDKTGLTGEHYQFAWDEKELREELLRDNIKPVASIFRAVEEQLGLTLKPSKEPIDVLAIDQAEKPSEN